MKSLFKQIICLLCATGLVFALTGAMADDALAGQSKYRWKIATLAPKGIGWAKQVEDYLYPVVKKVAGGELTLKIYWGGVMGDDEDFLRKMRIDQLQGAGFSGQGATLACPQFAVVELPFLFRSWEEVDHIRDVMYPVFDKYFARNGLKLQYWIDQDFDQMYSSKNPMASLEQLRKCRFVTWYGPVEEALFNALDVSAVPLNVPEVAASVRSRVVDSDIAPAIWMVGAQMYTVVDYINPIKIRYSPAVITVTSKAWNQIPKTYQEQFEQLRVETEGKFTKGTRRDNQKCLQAMYDYGVKETRMTPANYEAVRSRAVTIYAELAGKVYPQELLNEVQRNLKTFRSAKP